MLQSSMRSAWRFLSLPPAWRHFSDSKAAWRAARRIRHQRRTRRLHRRAAPAPHAAPAARGRPACRRTACGTTGTARSSARSPRVAGGASGTPRRAPAARASPSGGPAPSAAGRGPGAGHGPKERTGRRSDARNQQVGSRRARRCPARIARTSGTTAPESATVRAPPAAQRRRHPLGIAPGQGRSGQPAQAMHRQTSNRPRKGASCAMRLIANRPEPIGPAAQA